MREGIGRKRKKNRSVDEVVFACLSDKSINGFKFGFRFFFFFLLLLSPRPGPWMIHNVMAVIEAMMPFCALPAR